MLYNMDCYGVLAFLEDVGFLGSCSRESIKRVPEWSWLRLMPGVFYCQVALISLRSIICHSQFKKTWSSVLEIQVVAPDSRLSGHDSLFPYFGPSSGTEAIPS